LTEGGVGEGDLSHPFSIPEIKSEERENGLLLFFLK